MRRVERIAKERRDKLDILKGAIASLPLEEVIQMHLFSGFLIAERGLGHTLVALALSVKNIHTAADPYASPQTQVGTRSGGLRS